MGLRWTSVVLVVLLCAVSSCALPPLTFLQGPALDATPSGPTVAALVANVKCQLWEAVNNTDPLPYYEDVPALTARSFPSDLNRDFNLRNLFVEIEYVADFKLTLQVTDTGALNPSVNLIRNHVAP